ncbi:MAG: superoxide dismutase [Clostridia bacterium]|nr:superoxide dismutase [Clostridia bacterium]
MILTMHYPFELPPLNYPYDALEPYISEETMHIHHDILFKNYINSLNVIVRNNMLYKDWNLLTLLTYVDDFEEPLRTLVKNSAGGVLSHYVYFETLTPHHTEPKGALLQAINRDFGSVDIMLNFMVDKAFTTFGSGNTWLLYDTSFNLRILSTPNQDPPPIEILRPLLVIDMWEHAFFLQYHNDKRAYLDAWKNIINWDAPVYLKTIEK